MGLPELPEITPPCYDDITIIIVTYHPNESFYEHATALLDQFKSIIIVDNSGPGVFQTERLASDKIHVNLNNRNMGLGAALNIGCEKALTLNFRWAVTLDQDTQLSPDYLSEMKSAWTECDQKPRILGCNYLNISRSSYKFRPSKTPVVRPKKTVITSGCLTHLPTWALLGKFRADYFIDSIDHEFCLRARRSGYCVAVNHQHLMEHVIGEHAEYHRYFRWLSPYTHSPWRTYTRTRNTVTTMKDYAKFEPVWCIQKLAGLSIDILAITFLENKKLARFRAFIDGFLDGFRGKMGSPDRYLLDLKN